MTQLTNPKFDYDAIDKQEAAKLRYYEGELTKSRKRVAAEIIEHGKILCGAQEVLSNHGDGVFRLWLESVGISKGSAYNPMAASRAFKDCPNLDNLEVSAMYALASNEDAKKRALKLADKGTKVTHDMAKKLIAEVAERDASKPPKREPAKPAPTIEPHVAALADEPHDVFDAEPEPVKDKTPIDKCPNCASVKWTEDEEGGYACGKCHHPYGEPVGDVDAKRINEARSLSVRYAEAMMRSIDDLHHLVPNRGKHDEAHGLYTQLWEMLKAWK